MEVHTAHNSKFQVSFSLKHFTLPTVVLEVVVVWEVDLEVVRGRREHSPLGLLIHVQDERDAVLARLANVLAVVRVLDIADYERALGALVHGPVATVVVGVDEGLVLEPVDLHVLARDLTLELGN